GVEAYSCGPLGLGKRASNVRVVWFSFGSSRGGSFRGIFFGSSTESKNMVQLRLLWRLLQFLRPLAENLIFLKPSYPITTFFHRLRTPPLLLHRLRTPPAPPPPPVPYNYSHPNRPPPPQSN
nr:hypothetical protein [Tanacetum cinerariifolium]